MWAAPTASLSASYCKTIHIVLCVVRYSIANCTDTVKQPAGYRLVSQHAMPENKPVEDIALAPTVNKILVQQGTQRVCALHALTRLQAEDCTSSCTLAWSLCPLP